MSEQEILTKAIQEAIDGGWAGKGVITMTKPTCKVKGCTKTNIDYAGVCPNHR